MTKKVPKEKVNKIIRHYMWSSAGAGLIPVPLVDFLAVTAIQINMLKRLAKEYNIPFPKYKVKGLVSSLVGGSFPPMVSGFLAGMVKVVPIVGQTVGSITMPIISGATTYAVAKVFVLHFESGGAFLGFDSEKMKTYYSAKLKEGMELIRSRGKKTAVAEEDSNHQDIVQLSSAESKLVKNDLRKSKLYLCSALIAAGLSFYSPLVIFSFVFYFYACQAHFRKSWQTLKRFKITVEPLASFVFFICLVSGFLFEGSMAIAVYHFSRILLSKVKKESRQNMVEVFTNHPETVWILVDGAEVEIPFEQVLVGNIIVINTGDSIPADGIITDGSASIDQRILTGEFQPAEKHTGDYVFSSTIVLSGKICVRVEKAGAKTTVAIIGDILNNTADYKTGKVLRSEALANKTIWPVLILAGVSFPFLGLYKAAAIINAHYKYRPTVVASISIINFIGILTRNGILVKDGRTLDILPQVDTIIFDKTGTLTKEQPDVTTIYTCLKYNEEDILIYAAAAEQKQSHPIARAICHEARKRGLEVPGIEDAEYKVGYGLTVKLNNKSIRVGSERFMERVGITIPSHIKKIQKNCWQEGYSLVMIAVNETIVGAIELYEALQPEAEYIVRQLGLRKNIKSMYIISGDHINPTKRLANKLGISQFFAQVLPEKKADIIEQLQSEGKCVCYIGDGINDAIALKKAQVSISLRGASTVARDSAQVILMHNQLNQLIQLFDIADSFRANMTRSYICVSIPMFIGIFGVFFLGFGLLNTVTLNAIGLAAGSLNSITPINKYIKKSLSKSKRKQIAG
jgi:heavy metal translocating P-type ATPase